MSKLNVDLVQVKKWKLEHLEIKDEAKAIEAVRRRGNAYALNAQGVLIALSMTEKDIDSLTIGEECNNLQHLYLGYNEKLTRIEFETNLPKLQYLYLNNCALNSTLRLPEGFASLKQVYVQKNQLQGLIFEGDCPELELLDGSGNQLEQFDLPKGFELLAYLYLHQNRLKSFTLANGLTALIILDLRENNLEALPSLLIKSTLFEALYVFKNPLSTIPSEFIDEEEDGNSLEGIRSFLKQLEEGDNIVNDRAKLIIVGNGRVGKTSMLKRLKGEDFNEKEEYTHGIQIGQLEKKDLPDLEAESLKLKVWDFGGQEIFYATHQFFLSEEAIYILAWTNEKNILEHRQQEDLPDDENWRENVYWLENIRLHGKKSPILMVQTHSDCKEHQLSLESNFRNPPYEASNVDFSAKKQKGYGLEELQEFISDKLQTEIKFFGQTFPRSFETVIQLMENSEKEMISLNEFNAICTESGVLPGVEKEVRTYLHKSGTIVYFDRPGLDDVVFTNPNWLTKQVYKLINNQLKAQDGYIDDQYLLTVMPPKEYSPKDRSRFLILLENFKLIFKSKVEDNVFIAPQYLPLSLNRSAKPLYDSAKRELNLAFVFRYLRFMPENVMINFLSTKGPYSDQVYWRHGIYFTQNEQKCIVEQNASEKALTVFTANSIQSLNFQYEICDAFLELGKSSEVEISLDGNAFVSWSKLKEEHELYLQDKNVTQRFMATDKKTILYFKDFIHFFERGGRLLEDVKPIIKPKKKKPKMTPDQELELKGYKDTLTLLVKKKNALSNAYVTAYDPTMKFSLEEQIAALEKEIQLKRDQIIQIEDGFSIRAETKEDKQIIETLVKNSDQILATVSRLENKVDDGFKSMLSRLSAQDQQLISILQISEASKADLAQLFLDLDEQALDEEKMKGFVQDINNMVAEHLDELPDTLLQQWKTQNSKAADYTDAKAKFKLKIPIIPAILEYETEVNWDIRKLAKEVWTDFKAGNVFLKKKD